MKYLKMDIFPGRGKLSAREDMQNKYGEVMLNLLNMDIPSLCLMRALLSEQTNVLY